MLRYIGGDWELQHIINKWKTWSLWCLSYIFVISNFKCVLSLSEVGKNSILSSNSSAMHCLSYFPAFSKIKSRNINNYSPEVGFHSVLDFFYQIFACCQNIGRFWGWLTSLDYYMNLWTSTYLFLMWSNTFKQVENYLWIKIFFKV